MTMRPSTNSLILSYSTCLFALALCSARFLGWYTQDDAGGEIDNRDWTRGWDEGSPITIMNQTTPWTLDQDLRIVVPKDMILIGSSLLWCPNAKAGTSSVYDVLWNNNLTSTTLRDRCHNCPMLATHALKNWTSAKPLSFTIARNPYSRIVSAFVDKILGDKIKILDENKYRIKSFSGFIQYVEQHPIKNIHWAPTSHRCLTGTSGSDNKKGYTTGRERAQFQYDIVLKLEEDDIPQKLQEIFHKAGIHLPVGIVHEARHVNNANHSSDHLVEFYREAAADGNISMEDMIASVGRTYRDDIEVFGYSFPSY